MDTKPIFQDPKPGDEVIYADRRGSRIERIERVTPARVVVRGMQFQRYNGRQVGGTTWDSAKVSPANPESPEYKKIVIEKKFRRMSNAVIGFVSRATVDDIAEIESMYKIIHKEIK